MQEPLGHCQAGTAPDLPFFPWCIHLLDQSTSVALMQSGQERSLPAIFPSTQKSGWKGVFQREGLWLWPSSTLAVVTVLWNTPNLHPLSAFTSLHHLQKQAPTPCGNKQRVSPKKAQFPHHRRNKPSHFCLTSCENNSNSTLESHLISNVSFSLQSSPAFPDGKAPTTCLCISSLSLSAYLLSTLLS